MLSDLIAAWRPHQHQHTPCRGCDCGPQTWPPCIGARCTDCPPVPGCFTMADNPRREGVSLSLANGLANGTNGTG